MQRALTGSVIHGLALIASLIALGPSALATELAFTRNARTYDLQHSTLSMKGLAHACLSMTEIPDGLPCNPAMTPFTRKPNLGIEIMLSNGYAALENVRKLLDNKLNQELVDSLFAQGQILQIEANADVIFKSRYLNALYMPSSVKGFSVVRNEANPDVELSAIEEKGFVFQSGLEVMTGLYAGLQARVLERKFIRRRFKLVQLGTEAGKELLKPLEQSATYIEPGASYIFPSRWKPRVSVLVVNQGFMSEAYEELSTPVEAQYSVGMSPPLRWGRLELNLDYRSLDDGTSSGDAQAQKLHFGTLYHYGSMFLNGGVDADGLSGGVHYALEKFNAGILYSTTQLAFGDESYTQTVYVQMGWQI